MLCNDPKVVILCGGYGTRMGEETANIPKPMVKVGGIPILHHIMNMYSSFNFKEFIIALGYRGDVIKDHFINYYNYSGDITVHMKDSKVDIICPKKIDWIVHLIDTGPNSMTGGRIHRLRDKLAGNTFMLTYGDGVSDINIKDLLHFHRLHGKIATVTAVKKKGNFGMLSFDGHRVSQFKEKHYIEDHWINGGFFVFEPEILDYLDNDFVSLEDDIMEKLVNDGQLVAYKHCGFWECMDTVKDKNYLDSLCANGNMLWGNWND